MILKVINNFINMEKYFSHIDIDLSSMNYILSLVNGMAKNKHLNTDETEYELTKIFMLSFILKSRYADTLTFNEIEKIWNTTFSICKLNVNEELNVNDYEKLDDTFNHLIKLLK